MGEILMPHRKRERELHQMVRLLTKTYSIYRQPNGHFRITIVGPAGTTFVVAAGTASDHRAGKNLAADLARAVLKVHPEAPLITTIPQAEGSNDAERPRIVRRHK
jgi:hypothetical protein